MINLSDNKTVNLITKELRPAQVYGAAGRDETVEERSGERRAGYRLNRGVGMLLVCLCLLRVARQGTINSDIPTFN